MGIINRFLLFLYTLCIAVLSIGILLLMAKVIPEQYIINEYQYLTAQWQTGAGALVFFLLSVHLMFCCFSGKNDGNATHDDVIIVGTDTGNVQVTLNAISEMIQRLANNTPSVRETKISCAVRHHKDAADNLEIHLKLIVGHERSIEVITNNIREKVNQHMQEIVGINDYKLNIEIQGIADGVAVKKRRIN